VSVCAPRNRVDMPNLAFKAPTYENRDASFFPARQGGNNKDIRAAVPYLLFIVLTVKFLGGWIIINSMVWFKTLVKNITLTLLPLRRGFSDPLERVSYRDLSMSYSMILPPR